MMIAARAEQAMREGRLVEALADLAKLKSLVPQDPQVYLMSAFAQRASGDAQQAKIEFRKALELGPNDIGIRGQFASWLYDIGDFDDAVAEFDYILRLQPRHLDAQIDRALALAKTDRRDEGIEALRMIAKLNGDALRAWSNLAILLREDLQYVDAEAAAQHILSHDPGHTRAHHIIAQCAYEQGRPSAALFAHANEKSPDDLQIIAALAAALIGEDEGEKALELIETRVAANPGWAHGHSILADYRWQFSGEADFGRSFAAALKQMPDNAELWSNYISLTSRALGHEAALELIAEARSSLEDAGGLDLMEANSRSELGEYDKAEALFARSDLESLPESQLSFVRFLTRSKRFEECAKQAEMLVDQGHGADAWPYVSIAWRMLEDARWEWLEGNEAFVQAIDIDGFGDKLPKLAEKLRELHKFNVQPIAQSLRGGTQTEAALFSDSTPIIKTLVKHLRRAIAGYLEGLPEPDPTHPLLGAPREAIRFTGSWSVRLSDAGFHASHIHNQGVVSSAFYVALPDTMGDGKNNAHEGWLAVGEPPPEFNTGLPPIRMVQPKPGRLVLFPSTMWHGTRPFGGGERLTCAFDVGLLGK